MGDEVTAAFKGELQFAGYSDSSRSGPRVTFRLTDRDLLTKFVGCEGKRYACMLVELTDDETPAAAQEKPEQQEPKRVRLDPLCALAVRMCETPEFLEWAVQQPQWRPVGTAKSSAKTLICELSGVQSRKELDTDKYAAVRFHTLVRKPYMEWLAAREPA